MSIFDKKFKLNETSENEDKLDLLMQATNGKMSLKETKRVYDLLESEVLSKSPKNMQIIEAMDLLDEVKGDWLTKDEKENFVAGVWMFSTLDSSDKRYANLEQLKYVKQAVLGTEFKNARVGKYYAEF